MSKDGAKHAENDDDDYYGKAFWQIYKKQFEAPADQNS